MAMVICINFKKKHILLGIMAIKSGYFDNSEFDVKYEITHYPCTKNNEIFCLFNGFAAVTPKTETP
jgi:hypothetical protein